MDNAKIHLSQRELELVNNTEWILTKRLIIEKITDYFGGLHEEMKIIMGNLSIVDQKEFKSNGKISKGENYKGLPYLILDYPGIFEKENMFAIRTMFWWGYFFSITLHVTGHFKKKLQSTSQLVNFLISKDFYICTNEEEWEHHFEMENYTLAKDLDNLLETIASKSFLKISKKLPISDWQNSKTFLLKNFTDLLEIMSN